MHRWRVRASIGVLVVVLLSGLAAAQRGAERVDHGPGAETGHGKGHVVDRGAAVVDSGSGERGVPEQEATAVEHGQRSEHQGHEHGEKEQQWPALAHGPERERRPGRRDRGSVGHGAARVAPER